MPASAPNHPLSAGTIASVMLLVVVLCALVAPTASAAEPASTAAAPASATPPDAPPGFVQASGTHLVLDGRPYRFTGINIYNANSRGNCWYPMDGRPFRRSLDRLPRGETVIRAWFFQRLATRNGRRDWSAFDRTIEEARAHGMRVIVTLADHWGACERTGVKSVSFYARGYRRTIDPGDRTTYRRWVAEVVRRYRDDPTVLMWQLMNEAETKRPDGRCAAPSVLRSFAADMAAVVKAVDPHHLLSLGTIGTGQCGFKGNQYRRLHAVHGIDICEYHDYGERSKNPAVDPLTRRLAQCGALGKPLFIGEMGVKGVRDLDRRAARILKQTRSHLADGAVGVLMWDWRDVAHGGSSRGGFEIGPGDPALNVIGIERRLPDPRLMRWLSARATKATTPWGGKRSGGPLVWRGPR